ncbi:zona pellucida-like domain-containing protein 1 [Hyperolius riggenbachi]|uniref:zona pellucida-like domain-containing protein 1 n=1 Tax=Hyperolius riggenbachi TaxID=752182 RepID=UPI0035A2803D
MKVLAFIILILISTQQTNGQTCSSAYSRLPVNSDISVTCGPSSIQLSIKACPVYFANFDPFSLALNGKHNISSCLGTVDNSTGTMLMNFTMLLDSSTSNVCGNIIQIFSEVGTGFFGSYSNIQRVVISGFVDTPAESALGLVSYSTNLYYNFSCRYPMQYLLNNTEILTSFGSAVVNTNNGSFISTLRMDIFSDNNFTTAVSNGSVFTLLQTVYVQVRSNSTTTSYNVLLDQCFATPSPYVSPLPAQGNKFDFFVGCNVSSNVNVTSNGVSKSAQFYFKAFRFMQHSGLPASSIYINCFTKLCDPATCPKCTGSRRKRAAQSDGDSLVSYGPITFDVGSQAFNTGTSQKAASQTGHVIGLIIAVIVGQIAVKNTLKTY